MKGEENEKNKGRIISFLTITAILTTGTMPQTFAEEGKKNSTPKAIADYAVTEQKLAAEEEPVYVTSEIEELRTRYSKTYEQSDGSAVAIMSAAPVHFYDAKTEEWKEYDNRLKYNEETEAYESKETGSDMQVILPEKINEQNDIEVEADGYKVSITPIDMNSSSSKKTNEKKKIKSISEKSLKKYSLEDYASDSVLDGKVEYTQDESLKVEYIFSGSGLKENIILSEAPIKNQTYTFRIKADGLKAKLKKDNTIKLLDKDKKAVFVIPAPYMYDSNFSFSDKIKTTLKKEGAEYILTYMPDHKWLTDEERAYPVIIDPTVDTRSYTDKIVDTSVVSISSANIVSNYTLFVGSYSNYTVDSYIKFAKLPPSDKKWIISSGKLQYYEYVCGDGSTIYFYYNNIADKYIDMSGRGYTIKCKDKNKTGYDNLVVIDSGGKEYHFENGRLVKIIDTSVTSKPEIELKYDDDFSNFYHIEYITDGAGRKYKFNYSGIKLTDISYYGKKNTVIQKVSYEYDNNSNLTKVIYPDGKSVSYSWDNHDMISACNTDGYRVNFSYCKKPKRLSGIKEYGTARIADVQTIKFNPYCTDWQYAIKTFKADVLYTHFVVSVNYSNQINEALFDGIVVYKSDYTDNDSTPSTEPNDNENSSTNENFSSTVNSDNSVTETIKKDEMKTVNVFDKYGNNLRNETEADGKSVLKSNEYTEDGNYLKSSTDSLGFKTSYSYDLNTGYLNSITNADGSSVNYSYDNFGKVQKILQGTVIENSFSYDSGDRLSKITHNDFDYDIGYTEFGMLKALKAGNRNLINYSYNSKGALTKADYGNGQSVDYKYNDNGSASAVKQGDETLYGYSYDKDGNLKSIQDNCSNRETKYSTDKDGYRVTEETGGGVYHKIYCTNEKLTEIIGDKEKTLKTDLGDNSYKIYWTLADDIYSTYFNVKDKFGRKSEEGIYGIYRNSSGKEVELSKKEVYNKEYKYVSNSPNRTSELVSDIKYTGAYNNTIHYGYDKNRRISEVNDICYTYDKAGHLTTEVNVITRTGKDFVYDKGGNIVEIRPFSRGRYDKSQTFTYGNSNWKDLLTEYDGNEITYDEIGNPLNYYNGTEFKWTMGQRLKSAKRSDGVKISYTYNADGLRTSKTINNVKFNYYWNDGKLTAQTCAGNTVYFRYDGDTPIGFEYNNSQYYYVTDLLGNIIAVLDADGKTAAEYSYDAWGNCTVLKNANGIANTNPLRYKGYYYDSDTGLYCIKSRYYDSNTGRYINADSANSVLQGELNLFEYDTNPMKYVSQQTTDLSGMGSDGKISSCGYSDLKPPTVSSIKTYDIYLFRLGELKFQSQFIIKSLKRYFPKINQFICEANNPEEFSLHWNKIRKSDVTILDSHANPETIFNGLTIDKIRKLKKINCKALIILGCNAGHYSYLWDNIAYEFSKKISGTVVASDGTVDGPYLDNSEPVYKSIKDKEGYFTELLKNDKNRDNLGWVLYKNNNSNISWYNTGMKELKFPLILDYLQSCGYVKF